MSKIYTKTGDKGQTSLFGGSRVSKSGLRVGCYGTIDETISTLGLAYALTTRDDIKIAIRKIQETLFIVGAELASDEKGLEKLGSKITNEDILDLEKVIDKSMDTVGRSMEFVIPGVNEASAAIHIARTVIRRAERKIINLMTEESVRPEILTYVNRLSDALYSLARLEETYCQIDEIKSIATEIIKKKVLSKTPSKAGNMEFNLENIKKIAEIAQEKARELKASIVFSAVDSGGNLILLNRMKGSLLASIQVSMDKAFTANALKCSTHELHSMSSPDGALYGIQSTHNGKIVSIHGGFPYEFDGEVVGGIGISGGSVEIDMEIGEYLLERIRNGEL